MSNLSDFIQATASAGGGKTMKVQKFLTSGTWTRPVGVDAVMVFLVGAGASGGSGQNFNNTGAGGSGGAGGRVIEGVYGVSDNLSINIGAGGVTNNTAFGTASIVGGQSTIVSAILNLTALGGGNSNESTSGKLKSGHVVGAGGNWVSGACGDGAGGVCSTENIHSSNYGSFNYPTPTSNNSLSYYRLVAGKGVLRNGIEYGAGGCGGSYSYPSVGSNGVVGKSIYSGPSFTTKRGCGGRGGARYNNASYTNGENGGDGYCEIIWFE